MKTKIAYAVRTGLKGGDEHWDQAVEVFGTRPKVKETTVPAVFEEGEDTYIETQREPREAFTVTDFKSAFGIAPKLGQVLEITIREAA